MRRAVFLLSLLFCACTDPIEFDTKADGEYIIVDGFITDENGPHRVRLSKSADFTSILEGGLEEGLLGAEVWITDNTDSRVDLTAARLGYYYTPSSFSGIAGREYVLHFTTPEGGEYRSQPELLLPSNEIEKAHYEFTTVESLNSNGNIVEKEGLQFYVDSQFDTPGSFYRWDWDITYIRETTFFPGPPVRSFCYVDERALDHIVILDTNGIGSSGVTNHPVQFSEIDIKFKRRYSFNLKQYTISPTSYAYWRQIENQRKNTGSIFDGAPSTLRSNIINVEEEEVILGRFDAYGSSSQRIFIGPQELPIASPQRDEACFPLAPGAVPPPYCNDCALFPGSRPDRPDFWVD